MPDEYKGMSFFEGISKDMNEVTPEQQKAVDAFRGEGMGEETKGLPIEYPRIDILHQGTAAFRFRSTDEVRKDFAGAIIYVDAGRAWWPGKIGSGGDEDRFPACFSRDLLVPDPDAKDIQADDGKCANCPQNQWGSAVNDDGTRGRGKACKEVRRIFVIPDGHMSPHWMAVPPTSLRSLRRYTNLLSDKGFKRPQEAVTVFRLKTTQNAAKVDYSELVLELGGRLPKSVLAMVVDLYGAIKTMVKTAAPITKDEYTGGESAPTGAASG